MYPTAYKDQGGRDWACGSIYYSGHNGSDFGGGSWDGMAAGRTIVAAADGVVITTNDGEYDECSTGDCGGGGGYGNYVKIQHADGKYTYYAHLKIWSVAVSEGQSVSCGQTLGEMGSSGYSTGPHLHFEVREASGYQSDPFDGDCSAPPSYWTSQGSHGAIPGTTCENVGPCENVTSLTCGDTWSSANNGSGSTSTHSAYGCEEWTYTGPEIAVAVSTGLSEPVTVAMTGLSADLDLYALGTSSCDGSSCVASSSNPDAESESVTWSASAGSTYTVVVDGYQGATSSFSLSVDCEGLTDPPEDTEPPPEDSEPGIVDSTPDRPWTQATEPPGERTPLVSGCSTAPLLGVWWLALLGLRRRR
ncbi:MAG: M23 family metallopeptidase [Proteobacteria bacterium]|nr:M23 family metallopeptidase [Pseudomonadota bacterium]MCP4918731.1 M23 family metallopeptidase [Pseudomonadota bacterium]